MSPIPAPSIIAFKLLGVLRALFDVMLGLLLLVFQTEPRYVFTYVVLSFFRIAVTTAFVNGERTPGGWKRMRHAVGDTFKVAILLAVFTLFGNLQAPLGWVVDVTYAFFCGRLVRIISDNLTTLESDVRRFFGYLAEEVLKRNRLILDVDRINSSSSSTSLDEPISEGDESNISLPDRKAG